jgi:uncharacterized protein (TIGR04255 family)
MNDTPHFEPIFPAHAIERCSASISFSEELPSKAFQKVVARARERFRQAGMESVGTGSFGFQIDASGRATAIEGVKPAIFVTSDQAMQCIVAPNDLTVRTGRYVRWQPFAGQIEELVLPLLEGYLEVVSIAHVQLEYLDRFVWSGDWTSFNWRELLREDGMFIAGRASRASAQWHCHSGWIEQMAGGRRLVNVNVDLADLPREQGTAPTVAILTLMRDIMPEQVLDEQVRYRNATAVQAGLEQLHSGLNALLAQIITEPMAQRIGLRQVQHAGN